MPHYQLPGPMPSFVGANPQQIEQGAVSMDQQAYGLSDQDFRQRYPQLWQTQQTFLNNLQNQFSGNVNPQMQNVWARSGLEGALQSTGGWSLGTGTTGMANIARNLGLNQMGYQQNLLNQFQMANDTFRPRTFGLSGADAAQIALSNIAGQNNFNQAQYAYQVQASQYETGLAAQQSVLSANAANASTANILGGVSSIASVATVALAGCWVARQCFGDSRWLSFRSWLFNDAPRILLLRYLDHGEALAHYLAGHAGLQATVKSLLENLLESDSPLLTNALLRLLLMQGNNCGRYTQSLCQL